jgi:hypothetical protein
MESTDQSVLLLQHPFSMVVAGPSKAGKTRFTFKLLRNINSMASEKPTEILWYYSEYQPGYRALLAEVPGLRFIQGLPDADELRRDTSSPRLMVLDDLMTEMKSGDKMTNLFSRGVHHWNISLVSIVQNVFFGGLRTARINCHYMVLFKNPGDRSQVSTLARQLYPGTSRTFVDAFADATARPYSYLFVDLTQGCPDKFRLRTDVFPGERTYVYV